MATTSVARPKVDDAVTWLAEQRRHPDRQSAKTVEYGEAVIEGCNISKRLGDDQWAFLEQVGLAALDVGNLDLAGLCVARLDSRFPNSARATALQGMLLEARGEYEQAYTLYDKLLTKDESNQIIVKRLIAVLKCMDKKDGMTGTAAAIKSLNKYLDTYYTDTEAWQELAALYLEQNMYSQALFALEELLLLLPHNTFFVLQYAETLATAGELQQAYKQYLRVLEMSGVALVDGSEDGKVTKQGPFARALWGLKLVTTKLLAASPSHVGGSGGGAGKSTAAEAVQVQAVDALVTKLLLNTAYAGSSAGVKTTRDAARKVLQG